MVQMEWPGPGWRPDKGSVLFKGDDDWLTRVSEGACRDAGGVPEDLLGDYLLMLANAATHGVSPGAGQLEAVGVLGQRAADSGVSVGRGVDLYLSAARRVWAELPAVVRARNSAAVRAAAEAVLQVVDVAVAAFAEGHARAGRELVRREEALRREFVEDLLRGDAQLGELVERAEPFGLDLTRTHQIALAAPGRRLTDIESAASAVERRVVERFGDRDVLVATKDGLVVVLAPTDPPPPPHTRSDESRTGKPGRPRARRAPPPPARTPVASGRRPGTRRCVRDRALLRGGPGGAHHGGPDATGQPGGARKKPLDLSGPAA